ncbi:glycoside hydrolase superfamily [Fimicolochytrium jonesii]|uniref:glycoside hydrolase superfamily n=1 Tax=Fimicolochytrium jonesii TaxID=1396493 RepID=UPI0022FEA95C|nr:glycoside hydrolase superfamily [Fimicolochytrium jonesii]KAI8816231.1 glycoside hydrolase superfamily [Fimicolochytrium jonesii]
MAQTTHTLPPSPFPSNAFYRLLNDPAAPLDPPLSVLTWQAEEVKRAGGILGLTLEPTGDVTLITDDLINTIVGKLKELNDGGVPVILRYGHEMNGDWTSYGLRPLQFVPMFRRMAEAVHKGTKTTAMMWAPNVGVHYPYTPLGKPGGTSPVTSVGADNFAALDTNADDVLDEKDDPYLPYWPGPEYVDWVGLSLYYYQDNPVNNVPGPTYFEDYLLGKDLVSKHGATVGNNEALRNFYTRFGDTFLKPVAIAESGPGYRPGAPGASELDVKQAWWTQTLNPATLASLPRLKLLVNFEEAKVEDGVAKDWSLTGNVGVREAYDAFLGTSGAQLVWGDRVRLACDGSLEVLP